jgi:adenosylhomocysteine nucleosidase
MIGVMSAMHEAIKDLTGEMGAATEEVRAGMRTYHRGELWGTPAISVFSRWGKVAAATTATHLIAQFGVDRILFIGVAGTLAGPRNANRPPVRTSMPGRRADSRFIGRKSSVVILIGRVNTCGKGADRRPRGRGSAGFRRLDRMVLSP